MSNGGQTKRCTLCSETLPATAEFFYRRKNAKDGLTSACKKCTNSGAAARRRADIGGHRDYCKHATRRYREKLGKQELRNRELRSKFGVDNRWYTLTLKLQGGVCAVCGMPETLRDKTGKTRRLAVDHDHATGKVRGLLCAACNLAIGNMNDSPRILRSAAAYIERA